MLHQIFRIVSNPAHKSIIMKTYRIIASFFLVLPSNASCHHRGDRWNSGQFAGRVWIEGLRWTYWFWGCLRCLSGSDGKTVGSIICLPLTLDFLQFTRPPDQTAEAPS